MLVSVVKRKEPKMLRGSHAVGTGDGPFSVHGHTTRPAYRADLTYCVFPTEQDKSVSLPIEGKAHRKMADGGADIRGRRKRMPLCNGADTGRVSSIDNITGRESELTSFRCFTRESWANRYRRQSR
jgi:hypothetical protein